VPRTHKGYLVRGASIYTVRPVFTVTEHRVQVIEQAKPPKESTFAKVVGWIVGIPVGLTVGNWILQWWCHCS